MEFATAAAVDPVRDEWTSSADPGPDSLDFVLEADAMVAVFAAQRLMRVDALRRDALTDVGRYGLAPEIVERSVRLELATALRITEHAAGAMLALAERLTHRYPIVLDSLAGARITERHAQILVDAIDTVEPALREQLGPAALRLAEAEPVGRFRRLLQSLVDTVRAQTLAARHETALRGRRVVFDPADDGMQWMHAFIPAVEAKAIDNRLTAMSKAISSAEGETRTLDQVRADVLCDLLIDGDTAAIAPEARGIRATVAVTVPVLTLLDGDRDCGEATVEGLGPIAIERARELCGSADGWMRVLTHPETGVVLSVGRDQYRPPPGLRRLVRWRADRCMAPGCGVPASRCEIDHNVAWERGGHTAIGNLCPFCKGHHIVKHHGGWQVSQLEGSGGAVEWVSPAGRSYRVEPARPTPVFRLSGLSTPAPF